MKPLSQLSNFLTEYCFYSIEVSYSVAKIQKKKEIKIIMKIFCVYEGRGQSKTASMPRRYGSSFVWEKTGLGYDFYLLELCEVWVMAVFPSRARGNEKCAGVKNGFVKNDL